MWLHLKGPTGHWRSHGQRVNNFKSHSPADFEVGRLSPGLSIHLHTVLRPSLITPPPPQNPSFNDYYFRTFSGRGGGVFGAKVVHLQAFCGIGEGHIFIRLTENSKPTLESSVQS